MIKSFCVLLLSILLFFSTLGYVVNRLGDSKFVVEQARSVNLYGRLVGNIGQLLPAGQTKSFGLDNTDVTDIIKSAIGADQFYDFTESFLDAYLPWLTNKTESVVFSYELRSVKQRLADSAASKILTNYNSLPLCRSAELRDWNFEQGLPSCQLPEGTLKSKSVANLANLAATKLTEGIPDSLSVSQSPSQLLTIRANVTLANKIVQTIWGATLLMMLLYWLIWRASGLISLSICFLLVGILQIVFSLVGWDWLTKTASDFVDGTGGAKSIAPVIIDLVAVILGVMKTTLGNISIGFLVSGGILLVLGIVTKLKTAKFIQLATKR